MYKNTLVFFLLLSWHICTHKNSQSHRSNRALSYSKGGRSLRDESRLTTDGGPELPGRGGGSQRHSHGWPPVVSDQGSGGAWSPQSSLERRRGEEKGVSRRKGSHNNHSVKYHIAHGSQSKQKSWESSIQSTIAFIFILLTSWHLPLLKLLVKH